MDTPGMYTFLAGNTDEHINEHTFTGGTNRFNSGQVLWRPSEMVYSVLPLAFRLGNQGEHIDLDQRYIEVALKLDKSQSQGLSYMFASYCSGQYSVALHSHNWVTYHAQCLGDARSKMVGLREAQRAWKALLSVNETI
jgi:hypothetical protein